MIGTPFLKLPDNISLYPTHMKKGTSAGPTICNICKRKKEVAIREQTEKGCSCGHSKCTFATEIEAALEGKKKIKILAQIKPAFKIKILPQIPSKRTGGNN